MLSLKTRYMRTAQKNSLKINIVKSVVNTPIKNPIINFRMLFFINYKYWQTASKYAARIGSILIEATPVYVVL